MPLALDVYRRSCPRPWWGAATTRAGPSTNKTALFYGTLIALSRTAPAKRAVASAAPARAGRRGRTSVGSVAARRHDAVRRRRRHRRRLARATVLPAEHRGQEPRDQVKVPRSAGALPSRRLGAPTQALHPQRRLRDLLVSRRQRRRQGDGRRLARHAAPLALQDPDHRFSIRPFDGQLQDLLAASDTALVETYPADVYLQLGLSIGRAWGHQRRAGRSPRRRKPLLPSSPPLSELPVASGPGHPAPSPKESGVARRASRGRRARASRVARRRESRRSSRLELRRDRVAGSHPGLMAAAATPES